MFYFNNKDSLTLNSYANKAYKIYNYRTLYPQKTGLICINIIFDRLNLIERTYFEQLKENTKHRIIN